MRKSTALMTSLVMLLVCGVQSLVAVNSAGAASSIRIAIAYDVGGRGDHGINDAVAVGVDAIKKKFGLTSLAVREMVTDGTESDRESRLQFLASAGYSLIVAVGPNYAQAVNVVSLANPNTQFALIDDDSVGNLNLSDMVFDDADGSYLAGVLAGAATKTNKVGFIAPPTFTNDFPAFVSGLHSVKPKAVAISALISSAPVTATQGLVAKGVDVIFSAWSSTSEVQDTVAQLTSAKHPLYLIGVNPDQYFLLDKSSSKILIGAYSKHLDLATEQVMTAALNGQSILDVINENSGIFGHVYTVKDGGVSIALTKLGSPYAIKVAAALTEIKSGKIKLP